METVDFGAAIAHLKADPTNHARRAGWNGAGMWIAMQRPDLNSKMSLPYFYMQTVQGDLVPWLASQTDIIAEDWILETA